MVGEIPTRHLLGFVVRAAADLEAAQQARFFNLISRHPWFKSAAVWFFEKFVHVRLTAHPSSTPLKAIGVKSSSLSIPVCQSVIPLGGATRLRRALGLKLPIYWYPTSDNFTSVDAIICTAKAIILLQVTVSSHHGVKMCGLDAIRAHLPTTITQHRQWCFVFVTDTQDNATTLRNQKLPELEGFHIYSCLFEIGRSGIFSAKQKEVLDNVIVGRMSNVRVAATHLMNFSGHAPFFHGRRVYQ